MFLKRPIGRQIDRLKAAGTRAFVVIEREYRILETWRVRTGPFFLLSINDCCGHWADFDFTHTGGCGDISDVVIRKTTKTINTICNMHHSHKHPHRTAKRER